MTYFLIALLGALGLTLATVISRHRRDYGMVLESKNRLKEDNERLKKNHDREVGRLLDALPTPFFSISESGQIIRHNQRASELFQGRNILNRSFRQVFLEPSLIETINSVLQTSIPVSETFRFSANSPFSGNSPDKESHWEVSARPISLNRDTLEIQLMMRDITASVSADQIRQDFVANASHELRTPLSIISGYLENLTEEDGLNNKELAQKMLSTMERHVERINRIVEDMLVISKLESNDAAPLNLEVFSLASCVRDIFERLELVINKQDAEVILEMPEISMEGDRFYWTQILFNLIENALKQNAAGSVKVTVTARKEKKGALVISVCDNGIGIPSADLPYIFKRFFRVEKHHSQTQVKGTGLGLSIVKRAVEAHGGTIEASSTPGVQTTFTMTIPRSADETPQG